MGSTKAHTYSSSQLQILLRRNPLALWAIYLFAGQGKYRPIGENLREAAMKMSFVLVLLMKMTELFCRTFIGTNLCPEWERFLVPNVGKYLELCDIEININYQDHCCSWNVSAVCIIIDEAIFPITDLFCSI